MEQIYGSSLASMAEAVENASVVLMCVSEKYYASPNCRLEAEYAMRLRKPIVPLMMQEGFVPRGWLGICVGDKIYYKFSSRSITSKRGGSDTFEDTFASMLKEVKRYASTAKAASKDENAESQQQNRTNRPREKTAAAATDRKLFPVGCGAVEWSRDDVARWLSSLKLSSWMYV